MRISLPSAAALLAILTACATEPAEPPLADDTAPGIVPVAASLASVPLDPGAPVTRIAFGSCNRQYGRQDHWDAVAGVDPDLFVYLGDNVYGDVLTDDPTMPELRAAYYRLADSEEFAAFRQSVPVVPVWDDHDYGLNDAGGEFPFKETAEAIFEDVWALPDDDPRRARPGIYHSLTVGEDGRRIQLILLDTRYFRSALTPTDAFGAEGKERYLPSEDPDQTMLGAEQLSWLDEVLQEPADLRVLVTSVQLLAEGHGWEAWATLPKARARLMEKIAAAQEDGAPVLVVSGDRHRGGLYRAEANGQAITEMTASSFNTAIRGGTEEPGPNRLGPTVLDENFGVLDVDWQAGTATLSLRGMDGETFQAVAVPLGG